MSNPVLAKIRSTVIKRVLGELKKKADKAPADYTQFWGNFGAVLKEGIYEDESQREALLGRIPGGRLGRREDVAACVAFLASTEAGYVTGQTLHVNGGMAMI